MLQQNLVTLDAALKEHGKWSQEDRDKINLAKSAQIQQPIKKLCLRSHILEDVSSYCRNLVSLKDLNTFLPFHHHPSFLPLQASEYKREEQKKTLAN